MTPTHHPEPEELLAYASGTSPEWVSLVIACHLTYCSVCRNDVSLYEDLGGALLDSLDAGGEGAKTSAALDDILERPAPAEPPIQKRSEIAGLPRPLDGYLKERPARWRFLAPGLKQIPLTFSVGGVPARIIRFKEGYRIPEHAHQGLEMVLVLDGELEDGATHEVFRSGDLSRREADTVHDQIVRGNEPCTCLVVSAAPIRPSTWTGRILKALTGV